MSSAEEGQDSHAQEDQEDEEKAVVAEDHGQEAEEAEAIEAVEEEVHQQHPQKGDPEEGRGKDGDGQERDDHDEVEEVQKAEQVHADSEDEDDDEVQEIDDDGGEAGSDDLEEDQEVAEIMGSEEGEGIEEDDDDDDDDDDDEVEEIPAGEDDIAESGTKEDDEGEETTESSPEVVSISSSESKSSGEVQAGGGGEKAEPDVVELTDDDEEDADDLEEDGESESSEEEQHPSDPNKEPGAGADRYVDPDHLVPFRLGWKREVVKCRRNSVSVIDIYYVPPADARFRTREAKRKRASKADQEKYFEDFPSKELSVMNFNYVRRPLGLKNSAYETVRKRDKDDPPSTAPTTAAKPTACKSGGKGKKVNYKEVEEHVGLMEDDDSDDGEEKVNYMRGLDVDLPLCLQIATDAPGLRAEHKRRRRHRDPETCCTPPLAEDMLWSQLDEDPLGVYSSLGGRSSPSTPPPLRAVRLTPAATVEKLAKALEEVKAEAAKIRVTQEPETKNNMASHDAAIKRFRNYVEPKDHRLPPWQGASHFGASAPGSIASIYQRQQMGRKGVPNPLLQNRPRPGWYYQPTSIMGGQSMVKVKLPMKSVNGKRPVVELVMEQGSGRYQPIKFSNNMQVNESINKNLFDQANAMGKTVYQQATQVPRIGDRKLFLAINPSPVAFGNNRTAGPASAGNGAKNGGGGIQPKFRLGGNRPLHHRPPPLQHQQQTFRQQQHLQNPHRPRPRHLQQQQQQQRAMQRPSTMGSGGGGPDEQVAILVKPQKGPNARHVLLNVPRRVAAKVKPGTTLSFSASSDQKYIVVDSKIHPPVGKARSAAAGTTGGGGSPNMNRTLQQQQRHMLQQQPQQRRQLQQQPRPSPGFRSSPAGSLNRRPGGMSNLPSVGPSVSITPAGMLPGSVGGGRLPLPPGMNRGPPQVRRPQQQQQHSGGLSFVGSNSSSRNPLLRSAPQVARGPAVRRPAATTTGGGGGPPPSKSRRVLSSGEVIQEQQAVSNPCSPYCPGVSGFPELECNGCHALFHSKCVGISSNVVNKITATFKCKACSRVRRQAPTVINLD